MSDLSTSESLIKETYLLEDEFYCQGQKANLSIRQNAIVIKTRSIDTVVNYSLDFKFELIYEEKGPVGLKIWIPAMNLSEMGDEQNYQNGDKQKEELVTLYNHTLSWLYYQQWERILTQKCTKKGFTKEYKMLQKIGEGNFSQVYRVSHQKTGKLLAVKTMKQTISQKGRNFKAMLQNEIKILRLLNDHENIVKLHGVYEENNVYYLLMENVQGKSLQKYIQEKNFQRNDQNDYFSQIQVQKIIRKILKVVSHMTKKGIIHRDLKPDNIMITDQNVVKVVDFGMATLVAEQKYIFVRCGTPGYVAPEILNIKDETFSTMRMNKISDMFSIGCIFYMLIFKKKLFQGSCKDIIKKNLRCQIDWGQQQQNTLGSAGFQLLKRILQKDPSRRISPTSALNHEYFEKFFVLPAENHQNEREKQNHPFPTKTKKILKKPYRSE